LLVLCFLFGAVSTTVYETMAAKNSRRPGRVRTSDVVKQIDMTEAQRNQLNSVLDTGRKAMIELNRSVRPALANIRKETRAEIREILTDKQRAKFDQLIAEQDQARRRRSESVQTKSKLEK